MKQKSRILWIEDGARYDVAELAAPVYMNVNYDLITAENASDGILALLSGEFDVIIVDIRLPPGNDRNWIDLYNKSGANKVSARLGLHLLYTILGHHDAKIVLGVRPEWIKPDKIGVLTVEGQSEVAVHLKNLKITVYEQKQAAMSETALLELIDKILKHTNPE
jgi:hypothetical protein